MISFRLGEYVIVAAGEVHLQRCLDDLQERYAKIPIKASEPIIPFRETIVLPPRVDMVNEEISELNKSTAHHSQRLPTFMLKEIQSYTDVCKVEETDEYKTEGESKLSKLQISELRKCEKMKEKLGLIESYTSNKQYCLYLHAKPLPMKIISILEANDHLVKVIQEISKEGTVKEKTTSIDNLSNTIRNEIQDFYNNLKKEFEEHPKLWKDCIDNIWSVGPKGINNNILINNIDDYARPTIWDGLIDGQLHVPEKVLREYDNSVITGFQLAAQAGPICEEPLMGVAFFVEDWKQFGKYYSSRWINFSGSCTCVRVLVRSRVWACARE